ncbi:MULTISPECIES: branched-chain amino acid ABC transporter permease [Achromobacter]|uniref:Branched-chain amino acid ABC transporter permease n=1 Tax=Achromobacter spanius TaxID=217203 RepID=A0ABY8GWK1_9BURK|nr:MULTISPECIES: branched-chain amino acid ABC transporter permease [Achromobacter]WAI81515.1 branched-chain amino acid ABC transporter permease [Achromobacter spanius]WEX97032.1 branched-chain amino acid ABC transporter permease [Achromobacter sp. SS2-2022]WFP09251.1 branched-chain amino acid ABC transporter permease [Achromobacter spanius]
MSVSTLLAQALVNGVIIGLLYLLMAVGFTLVFGVMRIVNFAHGEFYMLGAFSAYLLVSHWQMPFIAAVGLAFVIALALGWLIEELVLKPFRHDELNGMIATIGLAMILQAGALMLYGPDPQFMPAVAEGIVSIGGVVLPMSRLYVVVFSVAVLVALYVFLGHSRNGRALRAVVQDMEIATAQGIRARLIYPLGFGIGVGLAAIAGALMAPLFSVSPFIGATPLLKAFVVVILGGLGSIPGAALASLLLGVTESVASTFMNNSIAEILILVLVMLVLVLRPSGLLGRAEA